MLQIFTSVVLKNPQDNTSLSLQHISFTKAKQTVAIVIKEAMQLKSCFLTRSMTLSIIYKVHPAVPPSFKSVL